MFLLSVFVLLLFVGSSVAVEAPPQDSTQLETYMTNHGRALFECFVAAQLPDTSPDKFDGIVDESMASYYRAFSSGEQRVTALAHAYSVCTASSK